MYLGQIFSDVCEKLENINDLSKKFYELKSDEDRFKFTYDICNNYISNLNFTRIKKKSQVDLSGPLNVTHRILEALKLSNESVAFGEPGISQDLALDQRTHLLNALDHKKIRKASDFFLREEYPTKYTNAKDSCLLIGNGNIDPLSRGKSNILESASQVIELSYSEYWKRQLTAKDDIGTGEVLIIEKPYSCVLLPNHFYTHCSNCLKRYFSLIPCAHCVFSMFCSSECHQKSLDEYHDIECKIIDILVGLKLERMELLSLRILICASQQGRALNKLLKEIKSNTNSNNISSKNNQFYKSMDFMNIYNLVTNSDKRSASDLFYRSFVSCLLIYLLKKYTNFFTYVPEKHVDLFMMFCGGLILRFMQSLPCNAHEVSELNSDGLNEIGAGVYATLSLINHSCDPNVVRYCCGDTIVLRAIKPIKKDEQILDNYGYHYATHSFKERQESLMKQYYFKCECEACTQLWPTYEHLPRENVQFKQNVDLKVYKNLTEEFEKNLHDTFKGNFNYVTLQEHIKYLDYLHESIVLPWQNFNNCQEAIKHCWSYTGNVCTNTKAVILQ